MSAYAKRGTSPLVLRIEGGNRIAVVTLRSLAVAASSASSRLSSHIDAAQTCELGGKRELGVGSCLSLAATGSSGGAEEGTDRLLRVESAVGCVVCSDCVIYYI